MLRRETSFPLEGPQPAVEEVRSAWGDLSLDVLVDAGVLRSEPDASAKSETHTSLTRQARTVRLYPNAGGRGGGMAANRLCNSGTFSAAVQLAMPCFHTSDERNSRPRCACWASAATSN